nr:MAG TPA: hypothetical protein [Caudoviricetes sp.]
MGDLGLPSGTPKVYPWPQAGGRSPAMRQAGF